MNKNVKYAFGFALLLSQGVMAQAYDFDRVRANVNDEAKQDIYKEEVVEKVLESRIWQNVKADVEQRLSAIYPNKTSTITPEKVFYIKGNVRLEHTCPKSEYFAKDALTIANASVKSGVFSAESFAEYITEKFLERYNKYNGVYFDLAEMDVIDDIPGFREKNLGDPVAAKLTFGDKYDKLERNVMQLINLYLALPLTSIGCVYPSDPVIEAEHARTQRIFEGIANGS